MYVKETLTEKKQALSRSGSFPMYLQGVQWFHLTHTALLEVLKSSVAAHTLLKHSINNTYVYT